MEQNQQQPQQPPAASDTQHKAPTNSVMHRSSNTTFLHEFLAGQVGGVTGILTVYPLDTAKIRLQTSVKYASTYDVLSTMIRDDGIRSSTNNMTSPLVYVANMYPHSDSYFYLLSTDVMLLLDRSIEDWHRLW